jgi:peptide/nickel transport system permease protein
MSRLTVSIATRAPAGRRPPPTPLIAGTVLALIVVLAIVGPYLAPYGPNETDLSATNAGPSLRHLLGTDELGRDVLARVLEGARISLLAPLIVAVAATSIGTIVAVSAAWIGGRFDSAVGVLTDIALAFPGILLAILAAAFVGPGLWAPIMALTIANVPYTARLIRSAALAESALPYVEALWIQGFRGASIATRHVIPNMTRYLAAVGTLTYGYAMVELAAISFLGLGIQPPFADWGTMVAQGQAGILQGAPQQTLAAGGFIVVTVVAANLLGEWFADRAARGRR